MTEDKVLLTNSDAVIRTDDGKTKTVGTTDFHAVKDHTDVRDDELAALVSAALISIAPMADLETKEFINLVIEDYNDRKEHFQHGEV